MRAVKSVHMLAPSDSHAPPDQAALSGICLFFTGLSGAGKSTIAAALAHRITHDLMRPVTLLDGDVVRSHLSSDLGFSRADRDRNIQRIAFVAGEVVRHGGIAIAAAIAPYDSARRAARDHVAAIGAFALVHIATPLPVCEARDPKGLYARARRGELGAFTGVSDPFEVPTNADVTIDTASVSIDEAVQSLIDIIWSTSVRP